MKWRIKPISYQGKLLAIVTFQLFTITNDPWKDFSFVPQKIMNLPNATFNVN